MLRPCLRYLRMERHYFELEVISEGVAEVGATGRVAVARGEKVKEEDSEQNNDRQYNYVRNDNSAQFRRVFRAFS